MSESLRSADRNTHLKIVAVAVLAAILVVTVGIHARDPNPGAAVADVKVDRPVLKAGQPATYTDGAKYSVRWSLFTKLLSPNAEIGQREQRSSSMIKTSAAATLLFMVGIATAGAVDLKELTPCKAAAVRMCDRSQGINIAALWKCGATLASRHREIGQRCVDVLVRYGQLTR
jgi:hypothetical protein